MYTFHFLCLQKNDIASVDRKGHLFLTKVNNGLNFAQYAFFTTKNSVDFRIKFKFGNGKQKNEKVLIENM